MVEGKVDKVELVGGGKSKAEEIGRDGEVEAYRIMSQFAS